VARIYAYVAERESVGADRLVRSIYAHLETLAATGCAGVPRDAIRPGLRLSVHHRYNIYFRTNTEQIIILRVLHSARDLTGVAFDETEH